MLEGYFVSVLYVSLIGVILLSLTHQRVRGVTSFGVRAVMICAILLPLVDIIRDFDADSLLNEVLGDIDYTVGDSAIELAFEDGVADYVAQSYGVARECVTVMVDGFDIGSLSAERIYVTLYGRAALIDYKRVEKEVRETFAPSGECEVSISLG